MKIARIQDAVVGVLHIVTSVGTMQRSFWDQDHSMTWRLRCVLSIPDGRGEFSRLDGKRRGGVPFLFE
jgi:hypothetical protein